MEESLLDAYVEEELKEEMKEKTVSARLVLSDDQAYCTLKGVENMSVYSKFEPCGAISYCTVTTGQKEGNYIEVSVTAEFSATDEDNVQVLEDEDLAHKKVNAKIRLNEKQERDLRHAFNLLDYTGEGKIKADDFRVAIKALGYEPTKEELQNMVNAVDKGQSGKLSFENFQTAMMRKMMSHDSDDDIMKSFRLFDDDDTGFISFDNIKRVTNILEIYLTDEEIEEMIEDADKDFDGEISVQEFMKMIKTSVYIVTP